MKYSQIAHGMTVQEQKPDVGWLLFSNKTLPYLASVWESSSWSSARSSCCSVSVSWLWGDTWSLTGATSSRSPLGGTRPTINMIINIGYIYLMNVKCLFLVSGGSIPQLQTVCNFRGGKVYCDDTAHWLIPVNEDKLEISSGSFTQWLGSSKNDGSHRI